MLLGLLGNLGTAGSQSPVNYGGNVTKDDARILRWHQGDEFVSGGAPSVGLDEEGWQVPLVIKAAITAASLWFGYVDEVPAQPPVSVVEETEWVAPVVKETIRATLFVSNEEIVPQPAATLGVVDEQWQPPTTALPGPFLKIWTHQDERPTPPTFTPHEEDGPVLFWQPAEINGILWVEQDEITTPPVPTGGGVLKDQATIIRWHQGDEVVSAAPTFVDDEATWSAPLTIKPVVRLLGEIADEDFSQPPTALAEETEWNPPVLAISPARTLLVVDEDAVPQIGVDEEPWQSLSAHEVPPVVTLWSQQDELPEFVAPLGIAEEDWQPPTPTWPAPFLRQWEDDQHIVEQPAATISVQEDYWLTPWSQPWFAPPQPYIASWYPHGEQDDPAGNLVTPPEPPQESKVTPAGKKKRYKKKTLVEIDGETFTVSSEADAVQLLEGLRAAATERAAQESQEVVQKRKTASRRAHKPLRLDPVELTAPTVKSADTGYAQELQAELDAIYAQAAQEAEIALHMHIAQVLDEEDTIILILANL